MEMDGLGLPFPTTKSFKSRKWQSIRTKKRGNKKRYQFPKKIVTPENGKCVPADSSKRRNGAIISDPEILDFIGPAIDDCTTRVPKRFSLPTTNDWTGTGGPVITIAQVHQQPEPLAQARCERESEQTAETDHEPEVGRAHPSSPRNLTSSSSSSSLSSQDMEVSVDKNEDDNNKEISGSRLIEVQYLFNQIAVFDHSPFNCSFKDLMFMSEIRSGFQCSFVFKCKMCGLKETFRSAAEETNINSKIVQSVICSGSGYAQLAESCAHLNVPCMGDKVFTRESMLLGDLMKDIAIESMVDAGRDEKDMAIELGQIDEDGVPFITVVVDASWGKRSYKGSNYNSLSGVACIMGMETKKVLFLGIRNSYCCVCTIAENKNVHPKEHKCFKNWTGTSTAMEADGIVEGFKCSIDMHGVKYTTVVGDGDSSVTKALHEALPYGHNTIIKKIECSNHLLRNYSTKLKNLTKKTENQHGSVPVVIRKLLESKQSNLRKAINGAVDHNSKLSNKSVVEKVNHLKEDLRNGPCHIFGDHSSCKTYFCKGPKPGEENKVAILKDCGLWYDIYSCLSSILNNAESLLMSKTNNIVEQFNSIIAKFIGGKRVNYSSRGSYQTRCYAAAIQHNTKSLVNKLNKSDNPQEFLEKYVNKKEKELKRKSNTTRNPKRPRKAAGPDEHYGNTEKEVDLHKDIYDIRRDLFLKNLYKTPEEIIKLQQDTVGQASNIEWVKERKVRLTASMFGKVCKMKAKTSCKSTVKTILYSSFKGNDATRYGNQNEPIAIKEIESLLGVEIQSCGLFVNEQYPYLGASPDGLIGEDAILEVKCPAASANMTPSEAVMQKKIKFCTVDKNDPNKLTLKKSHDYYYQIQGQLHVTNRKYCIFVVWTPKGISHQKIERDIQFWESNIKKLESFYLECILPEIIDPRLPRKLPIRDRTIP